MTDITQSASDNPIYNWVKGHPYATGSLLVALTLPVHALVPHEVSVALAAIMMGMIAGVYFGFALMDGRDGIIGIEVGMALIFCAAALAGLLINPLIMAATYFAHGLWDMAHHNRVSTRMPRFYIPACMIFDWIAAVGLALIWLW